MVSSINHESVWRERGKEREGKRERERERERERGRKREGGGETERGRENWGGGGGKESSGVKSDVHTQVKVHVCTMQRLTSPHLAFFPWSWAMNPQVDSESTNGVVLPSLAEARPDFRYAGAM